MFTNSTELCSCEGPVECAPTAMLVVTLLHSLYGCLGHEPDYFGENIDDSEQDRRSSSEEPSATFTADDIGHLPVYDFIIVGGGTAGCVLGSRLSENGRWKVLILEAGIEQPKVTLIPGITREFRGTNLDWKYSMRPKKGFCENRGSKGCEIVQGRVMGGTSTINDMLYSRGNAADYNAWAAAGNEDWHFSQVLPYFKYSEGNYNKDIYKNKYYHSTEGPLDVGRYPYFDDNVDAVLRALFELGYNYTDVNGRDQLGFERAQTMSYLGERVSTYTAYIEPVHKVRRNVKTISEALVTRVIFDTKEDETKAKGVEFLKNGKILKVMASKEVILSAGTFNTPKILMQSGIGPKDYLDYLTIPVLQDLPVGGNFHDHLSVCLPIIKLTRTSTVQTISRKLDDIKDYYRKGSGPLSANHQILAYVESNYDSGGLPDIQFTFRGYQSDTYYNTIELCVTLLTPRSRGQVILNATDPIFGDPLIYPNFLKDPADEKKLLNGIIQIIKIFETDAFKHVGIDFDSKYIVDSSCGNFEKITDEFWSCIIREFSSPAHNYVGTCKMGHRTDSESVVDNQLRIYGVKNLRVVDASIIPIIPRAATAAPVIMIAEKASDIIKNTWYI